MPQNLWQCCHVQAAPHICKSGYPQFCAHHGLSFLTLYEVRTYSSQTLQRSKFSKYNTVQHFFFSNNTMLCIKLLCFMITKQITIIICSQKWIQSEGQMGNRITIPYFIVAFFFVEIHQFSWRCGSLS